MWFVLGLVTLVGSVVVMGVRRWQDAWEGERGPGSLRFKTHHDSKTQQLTALQVAIPAASAPSFELKEEGWVDRLFKRLGISVEPQVGRDRFDRAVYVISDDSRVHALLRADARLTEALHQALAATTAGLRVKRLCCRRGWIRLELKPWRDDPDVQGALSWLRPRLEGIAALLQAQPLPRSAVDPYFLRSVLVLATSSGLAITGGMHFLRLAFMNFPFTVDPWHIWSLALPLGLAGLLVLALVTLVLLGRTSRAHLVLLEIVLVGGFGCLATAFVELRDLNIEADTSRVKALPSQVVSRRIHRSRRSTSHYLIVAGWNPGQETREIRVSSSEYARWSPPEPVIVHQHDGFLGAPWVESLEKPSP